MSGLQHHQDASISIQYFSAHSQGEVSIWLEERRRCASSQEMLPFTAPRVRPHEASPAAVYLRQCLMAFIYTHLYRSGQVRASLQLTHLSSESSPVLMATSLLCESGQQEEAVSERRKWPLTQLPLTSSCCTVGRCQVFRFVSAFNLYWLIHESEMRQNLETTVGGVPDLDL